jgi:U3 small nucleolar RNA-associated protein 14
MSDFLQPTTELETAVDKLLKAAELREQDIAKTEELKMQDLTPEEAAQRRAELRQMRDLMFRAEIKARRVAKIKSKTYRKLKRREKAKLAEKLGTAAGDQPDELDEDARMKAEVDRARERATLKHKNMGKWAQAMKHKHAEGELDDDRRRQVMEMHERGEKLRRRIAGAASGSESESDDSDENGDEDEDDIKAKGINKLRELNEVDDAGIEGLSGKTKKGGVMGMKFMQEGLAREAAQARAQVDSFQEELQKLDQDQVPADGSDVDGLGPLVTVERTGGRVTFKPGQSVRILGLDFTLPLTPFQSGARLVSNASDASTLKSSPVLTVRETSTTPSIAHGPAEAPNPWLSAGATSGRVSKKKNAAVVGKNSDAATLSKNALKKRQRKAAEAQKDAREDAVVDIDVGKVLTLEDASALASPATPKKRPPPNEDANANANANAAVTTNGAQVAGGFEDEEEDEERDEQEAKLIARRKGKKGVTTFEQRELVAMAFAGDNVVAVRRLWVAVSSMLLTDVAGV